MIIRSIFYMTQTGLWWIPKLPSRPLQLGCRFLMLQFRTTVQIHGLFCCPASGCQIKNWKCIVRRHATPMKLPRSHLPQVLILGEQVINRGVQRPWISTVSNEKLVQLGFGIGETQEQWICILVPQFGKSTHDDHKTRNNNLAQQRRYDSTI